MANIVSNLTKSIVNKYPQFRNLENRTYTDNGVKTYVYDYKSALCINTSRTNNMTYLDIDLSDYVKEMSFDFLWEDIPEDIIHACYNKYNGVPEIDMDDLISTCEDIIARLAELDKKVNSESLCMSPVMDRIEYERGFLKEIISAMKNVEWWEIPSEQIRSIHNAFNSVLKADSELSRTYIELDDLQNGWGCISVKEVRKLYFDFKKHGYIKFSLSADCYRLKFDIKQLMNIISSM